MASSFEGSGDMAGPLNIAEWETVLGKMLRHHFNIGEEIKALIIQIRKEMKEELVPVAEERANYGKTIKQSIRSMWALEYEIESIQVEFAKSIGSIDIKNLTDDFVEDVMIQSKPLQAILYAIRKRQKETMESIKKNYGEKYAELEPMVSPRPPKPVPKPAEPEKKPEEAKPAAEAPKEGEAPPPAEPASAAAPEAPVVEASA